MKKIAGIMIMQAACALLSLNAAHAALSLSVRPYEGGYDLRFGSVKSPAGATKEVTVQAVSDLGRQYQVVIFLLDPLASTAGQSISAQNFFVAAVRGSNSQGNLSAQQEAPVSGARTIVYTSSSSGLSDSFRLVFGLRGTLAPGNYRGRLACMIEPINASAAPVTVVVNVFADVSADAQVEITTEHGTGALALSPRGPAPFTDSVSVLVTADMGRQFRISQVMARPLEAADGSVLDGQFVACSVLGAKNGTGSGTQEIGFQRPALLYASDSRGTADSFIVRYALAEGQTAPAGTYRSRINFLLETAGQAQRLLKSLDLEVSVPREFDLVVNPESGGIIEFHTAGQPHQTMSSQVSITVRSNIKRQYQVTQRLSNPLVNRQGQVIPEENFTIREDGRSVRGTLKFPKAAPVRAGDTTIFVSDRAGTPESFTVIYELRQDQQVTAGDYSASIIYSISEI